MRDWYRNARPSIVAATASEIERNDTQDRQQERIAPCAQLDGDGPVAKGAGAIQ
jgi:hypothetical protein